MRGSGGRVRWHTHAAMSRDIVDDLLSARRVRLTSTWRPQVWRRRECAARLLSSYSSPHVPVNGSGNVMDEPRVPLLVRLQVCGQRMTVWTLLRGGGLVLGLLHGAASPRRNGVCSPPWHEPGPSSTIRRPTTWLRGCALDLVDAQHPRDHLVELGVVEDLRPVAAHDALSAVVVRGSERHDRDKPVINGATR